jgi:polygalacturonase
VKDAYYLIVKINDEKEFIIVADPTEDDVPSLSAHGVYNVVNYGADNTGGSLTKGIQAALDAAGKHPGSTVYVPPGLYIVGNIMIPSHTSLYLAGGSVLRFTGDSSDYTALYTKSDIGPGTWWIQTEIGSSNIKIYGRGTIDGNGYNTRNANFMADMIVAVGTTNFVCDGVLVRDSSFWAVVAVQSSDALFTNLKIFNRFDVSQDDGIDVCESSGVSIKRAIAVGNDDTYSTKTWPYNVGTTAPYPFFPLPLSDVLFDSCLAWTGGHGYKAGQGFYETQNNVVFQNSVVYIGGVGLCVDHRYGSATGRNILFDNIDIEGLTGDPDGIPGSWLSVTVEIEGASVNPIEDVFIKNIRARELGVGGSSIQGYNSSSIISGVTLSDIYLYADTKPATTLTEMNVTNTEFSRDIHIINL